MYIAINNIASLGKNYVFFLRKENSLSVFGIRYSGRACTIDLYKYFFVGIFFFYKLKALNCNNY